VALAEIQAKLGHIPEKIMHHGVPNVNYIEWMMGYEADWTRIEATVPAPTKAGSSKRVCVEASENSDSESTEPKVVVKKTKHNGMHVFMRENPGKDVRTIAALWRELTQENRAAYTARAHNFLTTQ